jgi:hypothetical protein
MTMTAPHTINPAGLLDQALGDASPDLMRHLLSTVVNALLSADADAVCGADYGTASPERVNSVTATGTVTSIPGPARSMWRSRNYGPARTPGLAARAA